LGSGGRGRRGERNLGERVRAPAPLRTGGKKKSAAGAEGEGYGKGPAHSLKKGKKGKKGVRVSSLLIARVGGRLGGRRRR